MQFLSFGLVSSVAIAIVLIVILMKAVKFVPQNRAFVVERFGKYTRTLEAGLNFLNPFFDRVSYNRTLKEQAYDIPSQSAITRDNIQLVVDGVLYLKVLDPYKASYGVDDYVYAVTQLAQTTMRSEIGKIELDKTFEEREALNNNIVAQINEAAGPWGVMPIRSLRSSPSTTTERPLERKTKESKRFIPEIKTYEQHTCIWTTTTSTLRDYLLT